MQDVLISVIVPVYKTEKYLYQCIESIVSQTYKNLEIILIDDGSPDYSWQICDEWAKKDNRIKVIHKNNGGAGQSRNVGLNIAHGDFICFVDSDDYMSPHMYKIMLEYLRNDVDIVECDYVLVDNDQADFCDEVISNKVFNTKEALIENINDHWFRQLIWNKMYKREVIKNVRFPEGKKIDDDFFTYKVIGKAKKLVHIDAKLYAYRLQEDSVMHSLDLINRFQGIEAKIERQEYLICNYPDLKDIGVANIYFSCLYIGQQCLLELSSDSNDILKKLIKIIQQYQIENLKQFSLKEKFWIIITQYFFKTTCILRNKLKIGV